MSTPSRFFRFLTLISVAVSVYTFDANARLAKESDLAAVTEFERAVFEVSKDGTYTMTYEARVSILTEAGRESQAVKSIGFNGRASKFELLEANTINDGVKIPVAASGIQIKEVGDSKVFDSSKETVISFPSVRVGSKIHFRYRLRVHEVPIDGFFSTGLNLELDNADDFSWLIRSEKPLYMSAQDRMELLSVNNSRDGSKYVVEIKNRSKVRLAVTQEDSPFVENGRLPSVIVSTRPDWVGFARDIIGEQEKALKAELPPALEKIRTKAEKLPPEIRMANVAGMVAQEFRYFGDWRRRNGGHVPRKLSEIAETGYGDCKDLSLVVVAIARALGLKADLAWVWRSELVIDKSFYRLPNDYGFNHAIARVEDGGVQWLDATNAIALPRGVYADIAGRPALVLSEAGVRLEETTAVKAADSVIDVTLNMNVGSKTQGGLIEFQGDITQTGRAAIRAEWGLLYSPREQLEYDTARWVARNDRMVEHKVELPKYPSRVARRFEAKVQVKVADMGLRTTAGIGFPLMRSDTIDALLIETKDRFSDIWLGTPGIFNEEYRVRGARVVGRDSIDCDIRSEWVNLSRSVSKVNPNLNEGASVRIRSRYEIVRSVISNSELQSEKYAQFQDRVRLCFNRSAVILSPTASPGSKPR